MPRRVHHRARFALLDQHARVENRDAVADPGNGSDIVRDDENAAAVAFRGLAEQPQDVPRQGRVEARRRLVGKQDARLAGEREGDHHALTHAPGKLVRKGAKAPPGIADPDLRKTFPRRFPGRVGRHALPAHEAIHELLPDPPGGAQGAPRVLEAKRRPAPPVERHLLLGALDDVATGDVDRPAQARAFGEETRDRARHHALAAPALADEPEHLARPDGERDVVEGGDRTVTNRQRHVDAAHLEQRGVHSDSERSRKPSPMRLNPNTLTKRARPGKIEVHQRPPTTSAAPALIIAPHSACGIGTPNPRKERPASVSMAQPQLSGAMTSTGVRALGKRWRNRMETRVLPAHSAASTKPRTRRVRIFASHDPHVGGREDEPDRDGEIEEPAAEHRGNGEGEDEGGKRLNDVGEPHRDLVDPAAEVADETADEAAGDDGNCHRGNRDPDIDAGREQHAAQEVHAVAVGAEGMGRGRRREERGKVDLFGSPRRQKRREHGAERHDREEERAGKDERTSDLRPRPAAVPGRRSGLVRAFDERHAFAYTLIRGSSAA